MVGALLRCPSSREPDHAADALAVAICHAQRRPRGQRCAREASPVIALRERARDVARRGGPRDVVVECGGVGYRLAVSAETLRASRAGEVFCSTPTSSCATTRSQLFGFAYRGASASCS